MSKKKQTFEQQLGQLEEIVRELDGDEIPLEQAINAYERGVTLSAALNKTLEEAQQKIEILTRQADGQMSETPYEQNEDEDQ